MTYEVSGLVPNGLERSRAVPNCPELSRTVPGGSERSNVLNGPERFQAVPNGPVPEPSRTVRNRSGPFGTVRNCSGPFGTVLWTIQKSQVGPRLSRPFRKQFSVLSECSEPCLDEQLNPALPVPPPARLPNRPRTFLRPFRTWTSDVIMVGSWFLRGPGKFCAQKSEPARPLDR